jgi:glycosyltransferase involved in cell wall biosynthesis
VAIVPRDEFTPGLEDLGVEVRPISMDARGISPLADLLLLIRYFRAIRQIRPAVFVAFTAKPNIYGSAASTWIGIPYVNTVSGLGTGFLTGRILQTVIAGLYRWSLRKAHRVFFHNREDRDLFVSDAIVRPEQARVVRGSGVSLSHFTPMSSCKRPDAPAFLFIGRFLKDKGVDEFLEAAAAVKKERPAKFQMIGSPLSHPKAVSAETLERSAVLGHVELLGSTDDVRPFIAAADCVVLPSYREGLPRVLLEAAAMGKPVITTDAPGCRDVVEDGVTGLLCQPRSTQSLASAMLRFTAMPRSEWEEMGRQARNKAEREFSEADVVRAYLDTVGEIVAGSWTAVTRRAAA